MAITLNRTIGECYKTKYETIAWFDGRSLNDIDQEVAGTC